MSDVDKMPGSMLVTFIEQHCKECDFCVMVCNVENVSDSTVVLIKAVNSRCCGNGLMDRSSVEPSRNSSCIFKTTKV